MKTFRLLFVLLALLMVLTLPAISFAQVDEVTPEATEVNPDGSTTNVYRIETESSPGLPDWMQLALISAISSLLGGSLMTLLVVRYTDLEDRAAEKVKQALNYVPKEVRDVANDVIQWQVLASTAVRYAETIIPGVSEGQGRLELATKWLSTAAKEAGLTLFTPDVIRGFIEEAVRAFNYERKVLSGDS